MAKSERAPQLFEQYRPIVVVLMIAVGLCVIIFLHFILPQPAAKILLDRGGLIYPFSVQNFMWIAFFVGLGELGIRLATVLTEGRQIALGFLPEDDEVVLTAEDLPELYRNIKAARFANRCFLPRLLQRCILQFQASRSIEQSASLLNTSLEMFIHEIDLRYSLLRYLCWLIPSLGFIGTVVGIGHALAYAGLPGKFQDPNLLSEVTSRLAVSFDGTLLALLMASILVFLQTVVQSREEHTLNGAGQYCLDNLINRLYVGPIPAHAEA